MTPDRSMKSIVSYKIISDIELEPTQKVPHKNTRNKLNAGSSTQLENTEPTLIK